MELIDKQAAIDAFNTGLNELVVGGGENAKMVENYLNRVIKTIKCLPSAVNVPDTNVGELISKQAAIEDVKSWKAVDGREKHLQKDVIEWLKEFPPMQPKKGKWIERECGAEDKEEGWETVIVCSRCDFPATTFYSEDCESRTQIRTQFCPNCGADMRGEQDG